MRNFDGYSSVVACMYVYIYVNSHEYEDTFTTTGCTVKHIRDPRCFIALGNPGITINI